MSDAIGVQEFAGCTCLRARRAARRLTQIYDRALEPAGLTINQFGVLARLYGASLRGRASLSVGELAELVGKHASTLNRDLRPLERSGLLTNRTNLSDRRVRAIAITAKGRARLAKAARFWREAQASVRAALGEEASRALGELLDLTWSKLAAPRS